MSKKKAYAVTMKENGEITNESMLTGFKMLLNEADDNKSAVLEPHAVMSKKEKVRLSNVINPDSKVMEVINIDKSGLRNIKRDCRKQDIDFFVMRDKEKKTITIVVGADSVNGLKKSLNNVIEKNQNKKSEKRYSLQEKKQLAQQRRKEKSKDINVDKEKNIDREGQEL